MLEEIKVPEVGESITEGILVEWLKESGAQVAVDDALFELETDKITLQVPSAHAGRLAIEVQAGETVQVGQRVATVDTAAQADAPTAAIPEMGPERREASLAASLTAEAPPLSAPAGLPQAEEKLQARTQDELSPAVRRLVAEHQLDPARIGGTGPGGRITKADVLSHLDSGSPTVPAVVDASPAAGVPPVEHRDDLPRLSAVPPPGGTSEGDTLKGRQQTRTRMTALRQRIAERLVAAQQSAAMLTTFNEVDMSGVMDLRARHRDSFEKKHGIRLGFMSFFVKAVVNALQNIPRLNTFIDGDEIVTNHFYDVGVAVGTDRGLVVPVIRDCDQKDYAAIEKEIKRLAGRVQQKTITLEELHGGCFTITNGGIYGSLLSTPILNPPQAAILGMHAIKKRPVVVEDRIEIRPMMYLALSYDHRLVDGKDAVTFLKRICECIENPERTLLDVC